MATEGIGKVVPLDETARKTLRRILSEPSVRTTTIEGPVPYAPDERHHRLPNGAS